MSETESNCEVERQAEGGDKAAPAGKTSRKG